MGSTARQLACLAIVSAVSIVAAATTANAAKVHLHNCTNNTQTFSVNGDMRTDTVTLKPGHHQQSRCNQHNCEVCVQVFKCLDKRDSGDVTMVPGELYWGPPPADCS